MRVHAYRGKECGLMLIGTATEIRSLGQGLVGACRDLPETEAINWLRRLEEFQIANRPNYSISFHLETSDGAEPKGDGFQSGLSRTVTLVLAIVGIVSVVRWVIERVF